MINTQIVLWKTIEANRRLRIRVRFLLFCSERAPTDPWWTMFQTLRRRKNISGDNVRWTPSYIWIYITIQDRKHWGQGALVCSSFWRKFSFFFKSEQTKSDNNNITRRTCSQKSDIPRQILLCTFFFWKSIFSSWFLMKLW